MIKVLKWIGRGVSFVLLLILCANLYVVFMRSVMKDRMPTVFGFSNAVVVTGSMEPAVHVNDMVIIHSQKEYRVEDIVVYLPTDGKTPVTHRIVEIDGEKIITKGDANNAADPAISADQIVGRVVLIVPFVGAVIEWMGTPLGMMVLLFSGLAIFGSFYLYDVVQNKKQSSANRDGEE